jgi:hypothetical protein
MCAPKNRAIQHIKQICQKLREIDKLTIMKLKTFLSIINTKEEQTISKIRKNSNAIIPSTSLS